MTGDGGLVEVQATAERTPLSRASLDELLELAEGGIARCARRRSEPSPLILATRNEHKLRELAESCPLPGWSRCPGDRAASRERRNLRRQRADQGPCRAGGDRGDRDRRRLGNRGGGARRRARGRSARYAGEEPATRRTSRSCCGGRRRRRGPPRRLRLRDRAIDEAGDRAPVRGTLHGRLPSEPRGDGGFGYDPAFVPDDTGPGDRRTMAELTRPKSTRSATAAGPRESSPPTSAWRGRGVIGTKTRRRRPLDRL